jgi:hypothetical protein
MNNQNEKGVVFWILWSIITFASISIWGLGTGAIIGILTMLIFIAVNKD